ncbi:MAG: SUMF1/EgtB/PvdO family nonheme iron enzyme [Fimbriimonadaceae bacterium]|nr:SUMF1/EgtB/PvdO family nonheme iron enzyme [Fimbriimonadaceae bacterium]
MANGDRMKAIGSCPPNAFGLLDVIGSVEEWCRDVYDTGWYANMSPVDPCNVAKDGARVCRGGSWDLFPWNLRVADRGGDAPGVRDAYLGFRCAAPAL